MPNRTNAPTSNAPSRVLLVGTIDTATQAADNAATAEYVERASEALAASGHHEALTDLLALEHLSRMIASQANTMAFQDGFLIIAAVFVFAMLPAWVMSRSQVRPATR